MVNINFYHVTATTLESAIYQLVDRYYREGVKILLKTPTQEFAEQLNEGLWTFSQKSFIPHGSTNDPHCEIQPILITTAEDNLNTAEILMLVGCDYANISSFQKVIVFFSDFDNGQKTFSRQLYKKYKGVHNVDYYQQDSKENWNKL